MALVKVQPKGETGTWAASNPAFLDLKASPGPFAGWAEAMADSDTTLRLGERRLSTLQWPGLPSVTLLDFVQGAGSLSFAGLLAKAFGGSAQKLVMAALREAPLAPGEEAEIRTLLEQARKGRLR